ncbi:MAG: FAD-dependent oxidoreductase [Deltaproteobacteria bacterium]|nr:FAD-dependent oxidoreductase [Deltaproteobacteria bacterium]
MEKKRALIVGGVAGGASCAARLRRLKEHWEIVVFDRGPYVSFANCGLPYYVGDVIADERKLLVASPELFRERFAIDVRTDSEVLSIDRAGQTVIVRDLKGRRDYQERYDALVLSPGGRPVRPPIPGIDLPGIFSLRTIPDSRLIRSWLVEKNVQRAVVVGAGFIGLEMAENLTRRGVEVTLIELAEQVMPSLDREMAAPIAETLQRKGVKLHLGDGVAGFSPDGGGLTVATRDGSRFPADLVILGMGIVPETSLAADAGLTLGQTKAIQVDTEMQTSDPHIWAVGDAIEVTHVVHGTPHIVPLAGPANRQGRVAADSIAGRGSRFRGVQSTAVCGVFDQVIAQTGATEKLLAERAQSDVASIYLHPGHHVGYYPGARPIHLKLTFSLADGKILGAQATGEAGVERRIDVIAMAIQMGATVYDLEEAELCYAPQFGAAKDPVNMAGMIAANVLRGDMPLASWRALDQRGDVTLVDVREPNEFESEHIPGALSLPLSQLRQGLDKLPQGGELWLYCRVGQRAYYAVRALRQHGFDARNLSGGLLTYQAIIASEPH